MNIVYTSQEISGVDKKAKRENNWPLLQATRDADSLDNGSPLVTDFHHDNGCFQKHISTGIEIHLNLGRKILKTVLYTVITFNFPTPSEKTLISDQCLVLAKKCVSEYHKDL